LKSNAPPILAGLGTVLAFLLLNIEIADYFSAPGSTLTFQFSGNFARDMTYSIAWAIVRAGAAGRRHLKKIPAARYAAMGLLCVTLLKLFFHDLARLGQLYRIGAFIGVAVIAMLASFAYQKFFSAKFHQGRCASRVPPTSNAGSPRAGPADFPAAGRREPASRFLSRRHVAWLRLTVDDQRSPPIPFTGARIRAAVTEPAPTEWMPVTIAERNENPGETRLALNLGAANLSLAPSKLKPPSRFSPRRDARRAADFGRTIREQTIGQGVIYRVAIEGQPASGNLSVPLETRSVRANCFCSFTIRTARRCPSRPCGWNGGRFISCFSRDRRAPFIC
jgi:hypothetical protein